MGERERLAPETFRLPVEKIRESYYSDSYFALTKELLEAEGRSPRVTMQVFAKKQGLLGGIDEAIAILKLCAGRQGMDVWEPGWEQLRVSALHEGDEIEPHETVMLIEGDYTLFAHLETLYLGTMARRSLVMTNVRRVVDAAGGKPILFFPARHDHWLVQTGDGWAAHIAGAIGVSTDAQASWWGGRGGGTIPHSLIAAYGGDTVAAARAASASRSTSSSSLTSTTTRSPRRSRSPTRSARTSGACASTLPSGWSTARWRAMRANGAMSRSCAGSTRRWPGACARRSTRPATST
jgi:nicotinate phosphoribosyltransferase